MELILAILLLPFLIDLSKDYKSSPITESGGAEDGKPVWKSGFA